MNKMESKIHEILENATQQKKVLYFDILERIDQELPKGITRPKGIIISTQSYKILPNTLNSMRVSIPPLEGIKPGDRFTWEKHSSGILLLIPEGL